jgi:micrococcal nuclease
MDSTKIYHYKARVAGVYDADTITLDIDLGLGIWRKGETVRLHGIDAPELRGEEREKGLIARDWLRQRLPQGAEVIVHTIKDKKGKYGRLLAEIFVPGDAVSLNLQLVEASHAEERIY